jgi:hypothetical protein
LWYAQQRPLPGDTRQRCRRPPRSLEACGR